MSDVNRCFSSITLVGVVALLSACRAGDVAALNDGLVGADEPVVTAGRAEAGAKPAENAFALVPKNGGVAADRAQRSAITTFGPARPGDARCRILQASAEIDAMSLRSPTVSAGVDNEGDGDFSISYDLVDTRRARLTEELADARCRRNLAALKLGRLLATSPLALTRAGYLATAHSLNVSRAELDGIDARVKRVIARGDLTRQQGTVLHQHTARARAEEAKARGEAARRELVDRAQARSSAGSDIELAAAERDVARLARDMRTANAFTVSVSGGYSTSSDDDAFFARRSDGDDLYAKVKMSVRTGALLARRSALENELASARIAALSEEETGVLWRAEALRTANASTLASLQKQRQEVRSALAAARDNQAIARGSDEPDLIALGLRSRIEEIVYKADLAGLDATIADTRRLDEKLRFDR